MSQLNNKEAFRELLWNLKNYYDIAYVMLYSNKFGSKAFVSFDGASCDEVDKDDKYLYDRLICAIESMDFEHLGLANHLLQRLKNLHNIEVGTFSDLQRSFNMESFEIVQKISQGSFG